MNTFLTTNGNKDIVRRYVEEVINRERIDLIDHLVAGDYTFHCPDGDLYGPNGALLSIAELRNAFSDLYVDLTGMISEGDMVAYRFVLRGSHVGLFLGLEPSQQEVAIPGIGLDRIADGRIAESWVAYNTFSLALAEKMSFH
jgi:predicted ester cyclase